MKRCDILGLWKKWWWAVAIVLCVILAIISFELFLQIEFGERLTILEIVSATSNSSTVYYVVYEEYDRYGSTIKKAEFYTKEGAYEFASLYKKELFNEPIR